MPDEEQADLTPEQIDNLLFGDEDTGVAYDGKTPKPPPAKSEEATPEAPPAETPPEPEVAPQPEATPEPEVEVTPDKDFMFEDDFKVFGKTEKKKFDYEQSKALMQKGLAFDQRMSEVDADRQSLQKQINELATLQSQNSVLLEQGRVMENVRANSPELFNKFTNMLHENHMNAGKPKSTELDDSISKFKELSKGGDYEKNPFIENMISTLEIASNEIKQLSAQRDTGVGDLQKKIQNLENFQQKSLESAQQQAAAQQGQRLVDWAKERKIEINAETPELKNLSILVRGGVDILEAAEIVFNAPAKPPENEDTVVGNDQETVPGTIKRERQPLKPSGKQKGRKRYVMDEAARKLDRELVGEERKSVFS